MSENNRGGIVWNYFNKVDRVNKEAECRLCHNVYKYKGTSHNLKLHLKHKHNDIFLSMPDSEVPDMRKRANGTEVWAYFQPIDTEKKLASCNACKKSISYKTTTANLKTHLRLVHKELHAEMLGEDECEEVYLEDEDSDSQGDAWSFFERAGAEARCAVCRALVPRERLREHLRTSHPKLLDAESEEETTDIAQEDVYTEIVFLENEESPKKTPKTVEKVKKPRKSSNSETVKRRVSSSSDEVPLKFKKQKNDDDIEQFGKYVTCLLKKVPQEVSMELQMEIVNLIMKKQLELKRNETSVLAATNKKIAARKAELRTSDNSSEAEDASFNNGYILNVENDAMKEKINEEQ